jgi:hypothetical protein
MRARNQVEYRWYFTAGQLAVNRLGLELPVDWNHLLDFGSSVANFRRGKAYQGFVKVSPPVAQGYGLWLITWKLPLSRFGIFQRLLLFESLQSSRLTSSISYNTMTSEKSDSNVHTLT